MRSIEIDSTRTKRTHRWQGMVAVVREDAFSFGLRSPARSSHSSSRRSPRTRCRRVGRTRRADVTNVERDRPLERRTMTRGAAALADLRPGQEQPRVLVDTTDLTIVIRNERPRRCWEVSTSTWSGCPWRCWCSRRTSRRSGSSSGRRCNETMWVRRCWWPASSVPAVPSLELVPSPSPGGRAAVSRHRRGPVRSARLASVRVPLARRWSGWHARSRRGRRGRRDGRGRTVPCRDLSPGRHEPGVTQRHAACGVAGARVRPRPHVVPVASEEDVRAVQAVRRGLCGVASGPSRRCGAPVRASGSSAAGARLARDGAHLLRCVAPRRVRQYTVGRARGAAGCDATGRGARACGPGRRGRAVAGAARPVVEAARLDPGVLCRRALSPLRASW